MDKNESKKAALIRMIQIYLKYGSADHPLVQEDFVCYLKEDYGIKIERKTVGRNIALLKEIGFDIKNATQGTYLGEEDPENSVISTLAGKELRTYISAGGDYENHSFDLHSDFSTSDAGVYNISIPKNDKEKWIYLISYWLGDSIRLVKNDDKKKINVIVESEIDRVLHFVMRYSPDVELISPRSARNMFIQHLVRVSEMYIGEKTEK